MSTKQYETAREVAPMFRTSHTQMYEWVRNGTLPPGCFVRLGRKVLFDRDALAQWAASGGTSSSSNGQEVAQAANVR